MSRLLISSQLITARRPFGHVASLPVTLCLILSYHYTSAYSITSAFKLFVMHHIFPLLLKFICFLSSCFSFVYPETYLTFQVVVIGDASILFASRLADFDRLHQLKSGLSKLSLFLFHHVTSHQVLLRPHQLRRPISGGLIASNLPILGHIGTLRNFFISCRHRCRGLRIGLFCLRRILSSHI